MLAVLCVPFGTAVSVVAYSTDFREVGQVLFMEKAEVSRNVLSHGQIGFPVSLRPLKRHAAEWNHFFCSLARWVR